jgi:hypothetical protein
MDDDEKYIEYPLNYEEIVAKKLEMLEMDYNETLKCNFGDRISKIDEEKEYEDESCEVNNYECLDESVEDEEIIVEEKPNNVEDIENVNILKPEDSFEPSKVELMKKPIVINADKIKQMMMRIKPIGNELNISDKELIKNLFV